jgi:hypothetical protein
MKKLTPELVATLLKVLRDEKLDHQEKLLIIQLLQKSEEGKLTGEDFAEFVKTFFRLAPFLTKVLIE